MKKKFTLIELIVVIAILGILASLIVPNISSFKGDATVTAISSNVRNFQTSVDMYSLKNNGQYPTIEQPTEFIPQPIDFTKLDKTYLKTLPKTDGVKYWVDFQGRVWASTIDAPQKVTNTNGTVTWESVAGSVKYQIFEVQGYGGMIGTLAPSKTNLVLKGETTETSYSGEVNKYYVVNATDEKNFQTAPAGLNYKGYVLPTDSQNTEEEEQPTIPQNLEPQPIQTIVPEGYTGIYTLEDLDNIRNNLSGKYILMKNLDFNKDSDYTNIANKITWTTGSGWNPIGNNTGAFGGTFDGNGLTISNLYINRGSTNSIGLFGYMGVSTVKNVSLLNVDIIGAGSTGALIGYSNGCSISNVYISGTVKGTGSVGGVVGNTWTGSISKVGSSANVIGTSTQVGGIVGYLRVNLTNAYATGNVTGSSAVGGLVGHDESRTVTTSYSTGLVTGTGGGLLGTNNGGTVTNSYWNTETSGYATSATGTGKTTIQMKQQATYVGWDFTNTWTINEGNDYPKLK